MKATKFYTWAASALMLGLASCGEDFLTQEPASSVPVDGYYTTDAHVLEAAVAAYDPMQWYDYFGGWAPLNLVWDSMGDDIYVGGGSTTDQGQIHKISQYRSDARDNIGGAWSTSYSGINRSIRLIDNATASALSDTEKNLYIAEGRALRAWYYLVLWKTWGNVPYYEENLTFPYVTRQYTADEVYAAVTADLESLLDSHVLPMNQPDEWKGRMTQAAAAMIYTDYVMYQADKSRYGKALGYMKAIISSNEYGLVTPAELWNVNNEWNREIIFDINFQSNGGSRDWGSANATGGTVLPEMIGVDGFWTTNPNPEFQSGWGFGTVSKEVYDAYEAGDLRRDLGILNIDQFIKDERAAGYDAGYGGRYQNTGYFLRKYLPRPGGTAGNVAASGLNWDYNLHLYRYAETLLNAAELALESGDASFAQDCFDKVRTRAGLGFKTVSVDNLIDERRVEFVGEGKRYFDLVRTGKAATVLKAGAGVLLLDKANMTWGGKAIPEREAWNPNKKYIQIPQDEIEATASKGEEFALVQNPS